MIRYRLEGPGYGFKSIIDILMHERLLEIARTLPLMHERLHAYTPFNALNGYWKLSLHYLKCMDGYFKLRVHSL